MPRLPGRPGSRTAARDASAVTTTTFQARGAPRSPEATGAREPLGRQVSTMPAPRSERVVQRRALIVLVALVAGIAGAAAISRAMSDVIEARAYVAEAETINAAMRMQVDAGQREIEFGQGESYLRFAARGLGYGRGREEAFALREGAPPAPSITPLGADHAPPEDDVLAGFLDLLLEP